ncbi:MAG: hypothetical protein V1793_04155 [Pseudomonadota bacterium]
MFISLSMATEHTTDTELRIEFFFRPGTWWTDEQLRGYTGELEEIAGDCFMEVPRYQCLTGDRKELSRNVITIARDHANRAIAFCSAVILEVDGFQNILHLGLTCVRKEARGMSLTHRLTSRLIMGYLLRTSILKKIWVTNVACVISSLGNVAMHFENVYPSLYGKTQPSSQHLDIARSVDLQFRIPIAINQDAVFEPETFVFRGSVDGTVFQKSQKDSRYFHRDSDLTFYYSSLMNFKKGDEVLQVGQVGLLSYPKYKLKMFLSGIRRFIPMPAPFKKGKPLSRKI